MSRKGTPIDDSPMESFHEILKKETLYNNEISSINEYKSLVEDWIVFYNTSRIKSKKDLEKPKSSFDYCELFGVQFKINIFF